MFHLVLIATVNHCLSKSTKLSRISKLKSRKSRTNKRSNAPTGVKKITTSQAYLQLIEKITQLEKTISSQNSTKNPENPCNYRKS